MKLNHGLHLGYCTNIHRGETWAETFESLNNYTLAVRQRVCPDRPYGIGLRLSHRAARELSDRAALLEFQRWLGQNSCYVFTINGFPFGEFHRERVKEHVYLPDWTAPERLDYTKLLFDLLSRLLPPDVEGSISTVPCGYKPRVTTPEELKQIRENLWRCVEHVARLSAQTGRKLHLGLEPEPRCLLETSTEVTHFFDRIRAERRNDPRLAAHLGVTYDTCHLAVEYEEPQSAFASLQKHGVRISKIHLSSALKVQPSREARQALNAFADDIYLHQVIIRQVDGRRVIYSDLGQALASEPEIEDEAATGVEWRIHFHIPLHGAPMPLFDDTSDHILGTLDVLRENPTLCSHLEMETYTWEVLPPGLKSADVVDQLASEYAWTLDRLKERGLA